MALLNNRYNIQKTLGQGGMGCVYLAQDTKNQDFVAVKECFVKKNDQDIVERIKREYYFMAKIDHPNLIKARDFFCLRNRYFIIMEYVHGITLTDAIRNKNYIIPMAKKVQISQKVCHAVATLNNNGVVHRDLKPSNIILSEKYEPKILDLGIAKSINRELETLTRTDTLIGTPEYMSPEQFSGKVEKNTDIFSLGVVLYQFFADMEYSPFYGGTMVSTMFKVINEELPLLHTVLEDDSDTCKFVAYILHQALIKNHQQRIPSMQEMFLMFSGQKNVPVPQILQEKINIVATPHLPLTSDKNIPKDQTTKKIRPAKSSDTTKIKRHSRRLQQQEKKEVKVSKSLLSSIFALNVLIVIFLVFSFYKKTEVVTDEQKNLHLVDTEDENKEDKLFIEEKNKLLVNEAIDKLLDIYDKIFPDIHIQVGENVYENKQIIASAVDFLQRNETKDYYDLLEKTSEFKKPGQTLLETILKNENLLYLVGRRVRNKDNELAEKLFFLSLKECIHKLRTEKLIQEDLEDIYFRLGRTQQEKYPKNTEMFYRCALYTAEILSDYFKYHNLDKSKIKDIEEYFQEQKIMNQSLRDLIAKVKILAT